MIDSKTRWFASDDIDFDVCLLEDAWRSAAAAAGKVAGLVEATYSSWKL